MAEKRNSNNLTDKPDPTIKSSAADAYPEGTHPIAPLADQDWAAVNKEYRDMPDKDKPDPSTVAQVEVVPETRQR